MSVVLGLLATLLVQVGTSYYLLGDSDLYVRDAVSLANGELPRSQHSLGFALFLAPIALIWAANIPLTWDVSLVVNAVLAAAAVAVVYRFVRVYLDQRVALAVTAVVAFSQGAIGYFAHIRPEALTLLLITGLLLALRREQGGWAVVLGALVVLVRVAAAPLVVVVWLVWARRQRAVAVLGILLVGVGVGVHLLTEPAVGETYLDIGTSTFAVHGGDAGPLVGAVRKAVDGVGTYLRYGIPRFTWPFRALDSPLGPLLAAPVIATTTTGFVALLRSRRGRRDTESVVLRAACAGFVAYLATLLLWPTRDLAAIRFLLPVSAVVAVGFAAGVLVVARQIAPRRSVRLATWTLIALLGVNLASGAVLVSRRLAEPDGGRDFQVAHTLARARIPVGTVMSQKPAATELLTGRTSVDYPLDPRELTEIAREHATCTFVLLDTYPLDDTALTWVDGHRDETIASQGTVRLVTITAPWCRHPGS